MDSKQMRSLNTRLAKLRTDTNPIITVRKARNNPKPRQAASSMWTRRVIRIASNQTTTSSEILNGDLVKQLFPANGQDMTVYMKVLRMAIWNVGAGAVVTATPGTITTGNNNLSACSDYGNYANPAGLVFDIPDTIALTISGSSAGTTAVLSSISTGSSDPSWVADIEVDFRV